MDYNRMSILEFIKDHDLHGYMILLNDGRVVGVEKGEKEDAKND